MGALNIGSGEKSSKKNEKHIRSKTRIQVQSGGLGCLATLTNQR